MATELEPFVHGLAFPEAPRWHAGALWFSDFHTRHVNRASADGAVEPVCEVPGSPSGPGWLPDGRLLVVSMRDRRLLRMERDGALAVHADLSRHAPASCNDILVDPRGRAYVGSWTPAASVWPQTASSSRWARGASHFLPASA